MQPPRSRRFVCWPSLFTIQQKSMAHQQLNCPRHWAALPHSKRLHIRYIVVVWSWWHGQFILPIQKAIAPTRIWRLPNTIQVSNITTDTWDKRRFGLSSLGTCYFLSPSLYTGCGSSQNLNRTPEYLLSFSRSVYLSGRVPKQPRYSRSWDRNWNGNSYHKYNTVSNYPIYYVMQRASRGTDTCKVSLVHVWTGCTLKQCITVAVV